MVEAPADRPVIAQGFVCGRVQGVWFRESTRRRAVELGLAGFVRNLPDGRVEAQFVGPRSRVELALSFIAQGPQHARVDWLEGFEIEEVAVKSADSADGFLVR